MVMPCGFVGNFYENFVTMQALKFWESGKKIVAVGRNFATHAKGDSSIYNYN